MKFMNYEIKLSIKIFEKLKKSFKLNIKKFIGK